MKVRLARTAGFCMGVRRAMELALGAAQKETGEVSTFGPLIHNPQVLGLLAEKGIEVISNIPEANTAQGGTVIIRAHGVPPSAKAGLKKAGYDKLVDGTCPRVVRVQAIIRRAARQGRDIIIVGDDDHPEVVGLKGHGGDRCHVVSKPDKVAGLGELRQPVIVAQTTQSEELFSAITGEVKRLHSQVEVHRTICEATKKRQDEVMAMARECDGMVVVGGKASGNTRRLGELAAESGKPVFLVETEAELDKKALSRLKSVGVTAGASTPNWMIKKVIRELLAIRSEKEKPHQAFFRSAIRFLVRSQLLVALGAAGMTLAALLLQGISPHGFEIPAAACYLYAMHILNHFLDKEAGQYNEPDRAHFLNSHKTFLIMAGILSAGAGLVFCALMGWLPFALVAVMSVLGIVYSLPVIPGWIERRVGVHRIKDIPGSKTLSAAAAWAVITAVVPAAASEPYGYLLTGLAFAYVFTLVFIRSAIFDILDVQGDLIVGKETIPIVLGEKKTLAILWGLASAMALVLILAAASGAAPHLAWWLLVPLGGLALMQKILARDLMMPGALSEGLVDLNFVAAGVFSLAWHLLT